MDEQEWLQTFRSREMLAHLGDGASDRKLRLFAVACCREVEHLLPDELCRAALRAAERLADGVTGEADRAGHFGAVFDRWCRDHDPESRDPTLRAAWAVLGCLDSRGGAAAAAHTPYEAFCAAGVVSSVWLLREAALIREIFGNPFSPVAFAPAWRTPDVTSLAGRAYGYGDSGAMPVLGDALEEAGCGVADVLGHCRAAGRHPRGCWALDLILGRA